MELKLVLAAALLWALMGVSAVASTVWALLANRKKRGAATLALCLWCVVAGGTLTSALWAWMTVTNTEYQYAKIARMPPDAAAKEVDLSPMQMLKFYINFDAVGRKWLYLTVLLPLLFSISYFRKCLHLPIEKKPSLAADDDLFSPER